MTAWAAHASLSAIGGAGRQGLSYVAAFRAYSWDDEIAILAERFFGHCPGAARQVVLFDETKGRVELPYETVFYSDETSLRLGLPNVPADTSLWYNVDYGLYFLADALPEHDHYLLSESDLAVNLPLDAMLERIAADGIDLAVHNLRPSTPEWFWHRNASAIFGEPWRSLLFFFIASRRAAERLLEARRQFAARYRAGDHADWPFCEPFVPSILKADPGMRFAALSDYADVSNLDYRPRISLRDPRASRPGSLVHSVLGGRRYVEAMLEEHRRPRDWLIPGTGLWRALRHEPLAELAPPFRAAFLRVRDHAGLSALEKEMAMQGLDPGRGDDLALGRPALSSSVSRWSHGESPSRDACGANGSALAEEYGFHTDQEIGPWWMVDLVDEVVVDSVAILNRRTWSERFVTFRIDGSRDGSAWITRFSKLDLAPVSSDPDRPWRRRFDDPFVARYCRIVLLDLGPQVLHLRRVQIYGRRIAAPPAAS